MTDFRTVTKRRSDFNDQNRLMDWHMNLGFDCPATDIDITLSQDGTVTDRVLLEYDNEIPVASIDYKLRDFSCSKDPSIAINSGIRVQRNYASMAKVPFFVIAYDDQFQHFWLFLGLSNQKAIDKVHSMSRNPSHFSPKKYYKFNELTMAKFLYRLRDRDLPENIASNLYSGE